MDSIGYKVNLNNHVDFYTMLDETVPLFFFYVILAELNCQYDITANLQPLGDWD